MPRNVNDLTKTGGGSGHSGKYDNWPDAGWHVAQCTGVERKRSVQKGTEYLELSFVTEDGKEFTDALFLTTGAMSRLAIVASRVCGFDGDVSDDDDKAIVQLAEVIESEAARGRMAAVKIEEVKETYVAKQGKHAGETMTATKKKVAFAGYDHVDEGEVADTEVTPQPAATKPTPPVNAGDDNLPF